MSNIPQTLTHYNLFVDSVGYAGLITELTLPKLSFVIHDHRAGGMDAPIPIEMGMDKLEANFTMASYEEAILMSIGFRKGGSLPVVARAALKRDMDVAAFTVTLRGKIKEVDMGNWKANEQSTMKFSLACDYYRLDRDALNLIEIDIKNMVRKIGGIDQLAEVRRAILI